MTGCPYVAGPRCSGCDGSCWDVATRQPDPPPACEACSLITGGMTYCQNLCDGVTDQTSLDAARERYGARILDADPDTPTTEHPGYCFSFEPCGNCHRCRPDAPVDDGLVEQIARVLLLHDAEVESDGEHIRCTGVGCDFRSEAIGAARTKYALHVAQLLVVARPWQAEVEAAEARGFEDGRAQQANDHEAEVEAARQDAHALAKAWDDGWFSARQVDRAIPKPGDNPYRAARGETRQP